MDTQIEHVRQVTVKAVEADLKQVRREVKTHRREIKNLLAEEKVLEGLRARLSDTTPAKRQAPGAPKPKTRRRTPQERKALIEEAMDRHEARGSAEIARRSGVHQTQVLEYLRAHERAGLVRETTGFKKNRRWVFAAPATVTKIKPGVGVYS